MKRIFPIAMLPLMAATLMSCSEDLPAQDPSASAGTQAAKASTAADGSSSSYEATGLAHNLMLEAFLSRNSPPPSTLGDVDTAVSALMQEHGLAVPDCGSFSCPALVAEIIGDPISFYESSIAESGLSHGAAVYFAQFLQGFSLPAQGAEARLALVRATMLEVQDGPEFTPLDKETLLTTLAITEASLLFGKGRKDKDWETSVGNIVAASRGANEEPALSLRLSLMAGIMQHYNLQAY